MKVFPFYATNPEKRQFSFCSPKSAILSSATCNYHNQFRTGKLPSRSSEEVVHARNVIAFFVWAWPSDFCDWSCSPWWATSWRGTHWSYRRQKGGSTPRTLIPIWTLLSGMKNGWIRMANYISWQKSDCTLGWMKLTWMKTKRSIR